MPSSTNPMISSPNKLKIGLFGLTLIPVQTLVPELYQPTWKNALEVGQMADRIGLEVILPPARFKGYLDHRFDHQTNDILDVFTFAAAMAQATSYSSVVTTTFAPMVHPAMLAKQTATLDQIAGGRYALNIVGGWNRREFEVFGLDLLAHDERYAYLEEWLDVLRKLWTEKDDFDFAGKYLTLKGAISRPQPIQVPGIPVINAGMSAVGADFAARNADVGFIVLQGTNVDAWTRQVSDLKALARSYGREIKIWTTTSVTIRDTDVEARDYEDYFSVQMLDGEAVDSMMEGFVNEAGLKPGTPKYEAMQRTMVSGGGYGIVGSPETVAREMAAISEAGVDGIVLKSVDFLDTLGRMERQVLPILEGAGVRVPFGDILASRAA